MDLRWRGFISISGVSLLLLNKYGNRLVGREWLTIDQFFWSLRKKMYICKVDVHWKCKCAVKIWSTNFDSKIKKIGKLKFLLYICKVETNSTKVLWEIFILFELIVYLLFASPNKGNCFGQIFSKIRTTPNRPTRVVNAANKGIRVQNGCLYSIATKGCSACIKDARLTDDTSPSKGGATPKTAEVANSLTTFVVRRTAAFRPSS